VSGNFRFPNYRQFSKKNRENYRKNIAQIVDKYYITTLSFNIERRSEPRFLFIQLLVGRIYIRSALLSRFHPISIFYQRNAINYYLFYVRSFPFRVVFWTAYPPIPIKCENRIQSRILIPLSTYYAKYRRLGFEYTLTNYKTVTESQFRRYSEIPSSNSSYLQCFTAFDSSVKMSAVSAKFWVYTAHKSTSFAYRQQIRTRCRLRRRQYLYRIIDDVCFRRNYNKSGSTYA